MPKVNPGLGVNMQKTVQLTKNYMLKKLKQPMNKRKKIRKKKERKCKKKNTKKSML